MEIIKHGDSLHFMKQNPNTFDLICTSPPYNLGKEYENKQSMNLYLEWIKPFINEFYKTLKEDGQIAINIGNYIENGKVFPLDCILFNEFISVGFIPRGRIIWHFGHGLHCKNRFSGRHETFLWFSKSNKYTFNLDTVRVPSKYPNKKHFKGPKKGELSGNPLGKNPGDVWDIPNVKHNHPEKTIHPCQFPELLVERFVLSLTNEGCAVFDPFAGSGTTGYVCRKHKRNCVLVEKEKKYIDIINQRI